MADPPSRTDWPGLTPGQTFVRDHRVQRPLSPLSFTSWFPIHSRAHRQVFEEFGIPVADFDHRHHLGRVYTRTVPLVDRGADSGVPPPIVARLLTRIVPSLRRRTANALRWQGSAPIRTLIEEWEREGRREVHRRTGELRKRSLASLSDTELAAHVDTVQAHLLRVAIDHFRLSLGAVAIPIGRLGLFVERRLGWSAGDVLALTQGHGDASRAQSGALGALVASLGPERLHQSDIDPSWLTGDAEVAAYIERFGFHAHLELADPTEAEDLERLAQRLRRYGRRRADGTPTADQLRTRALQAEERAAEMIPAVDRAEFQSLVALARVGQPLGDETEGTVLTALSLMRAIGVEVARRWVAAGGLAAPSDVWFLSLDELLAGLRSVERRPVVADVIERRRAFEAGAAIRPPDHIGPPPQPLPRPSSVPARLRSTLGASLWALNATEGRPVAASVERRITRGLAGSPGVATGPARVVLHAGELSKVEPGDILICPTATATWSPALGLASGLVTERGGPLSHAGILAREFGIPAVLSAADATRRIPEGAPIRLDGAAGTVEALREPE
ncbi:MAG: PEP-utilizing enzyme [Actinomycetota bacterium]